MMPHLKFIPSSSGSGWIFNAHTSQVMQPNGQLLPDAYWDYPNLPGPAGLFTAMQSVKNLLHAHPEIRVTLDLTPEGAQILLQSTDTSPDDPAYRSVYVSPAEVLKLSQLDAIRGYLAGLLRWQGV